MPEADVGFAAPDAAPAGAVADTGGSNTPAQSSEITFTPEGERVQSGATDTTGQASETDEERNQRTIRETQQRQDKARNAYQKRVDELTADKHAERRAREAAEQRENELRQTIAQQQTRQAAAPAGPPDPNTFRGTYEEYLAAVADYNAGRTTDARIRQFEERQLAAAQQAHAQAQAESIAARFHAKHTEDAKSIPDYEAVVGQSQVPVPPHVAMELANANRPAAVIHYLAQHPDIGMRLAQMHPVEVARVVSRIDTAMSSARTTSNAPAPGRAAQGRSGGSSNDNPPEDTDAYFRWAKARGLR